MRVYFVYIYIQVLDIGLLTYNGQDGTFLSIFLQVRLHDNHVKKLNLKENEDSKQQTAGAAGSGKTVRQIDVFWDKRKVS